MSDDDGKIKLGIDISALERDATKATNMLAKVFENQGLGANLLGSGVPANQIQAQGKDTLRGVIDALERIEKTLVIGFTALNGSPGVGGGGPRRGPDGRFLPSEGSDGGGGKGGGSAFGNALAFADKFPQREFANYISGTGYRSDALQLATGLFGSLPVVGKALGLITSQYDKSDSFLDKSLQAYRRGGIQGRTGLREIVQTDSGRAAMHNAGLTLQEVTELQQQQLNSTYGASSAGLRGIMQMQGQLGMGSEGLGLMHSFVAGGGAKGGDEMKVFAEVVGDAFATKLERGRWPAMVESMTRAAQAMGEIGTVSVQGMIEQQNFMNQLGDRYLPGGAGEGGMRSLITGMSTGQGGGLGNYEALRAAGMGTTQDYWGAEFDVETGALEGPGGLKKLLDSVAATDPIVKYYLAGKMPLGKAALIFNQMHGGQYKPREIADLLSAMKAGKTPDVNTSWLQSAGSAILKTIGLPGPEDNMIQNTVEHTLEGTGVGPSGDVYDTSSRSPDQSVINPSDLARLRRLQLLLRLQSQGRDASASGIGQVSATEIQGAAESAGIPSDTMRSWFAIESGGMLRPDSGDYDKKTNAVTARGLNRMSLEEAKSLGYTESDWLRMSSDKKLSLDASSKLAAKYIAAAKKQEPGWSQSDLLHLMKYQHGGSGYARDAFNDYRSQHAGVDPGSWGEFYDAEKSRLSGSPGVGALGALQNANKLDVHITVDQTGRYVGTSVRGGGPNVTASQGQMVGGKR